MSTFISAVEEPPVRPHHAPQPVSQHGLLHTLKASIARRSRRPIVRVFTLALIYTLGLTFSLWLAYQLRFDFAVPYEFKVQFLLVVWWIVFLKLIMLHAFRQFSGLLTFFSTPDLGRLFGALGASFFLILMVRITHIYYAPPRGVIVTDFTLSILAVSLGRFGLRLARENGGLTKTKTAQNSRLVGIVGAGEVGASLARELLVKRNLGMVPVAFFDDDPHLWRSQVHGIPIVGAPEILLYTDAPRVKGPRSLFQNGFVRLFEAKRKSLGIQEVIIAMPSAPQTRIREIVKFLQRAQIGFQTVPSLDQLATGRVKVSQIRPVEIQDLLGRDEVTLETEKIREILAGKVVAVTGAGGSIGSELCRQIARFKPRQLLLIEQSEVQMFQIEQGLIELGHGPLIVPCVADVLDGPRMRRLFETYKPHVVFHAAAHKHVPLMESHPGEAIKNNTFGTLRTAELALEHNAERFVFISTDKAVNPTNVMGASKRLAEMSMQALSASRRGPTKFMSVRFGNVLGSSGSVIPTFTKQIAEGGPVKVTHPEITRYFMTTPEAVSLVLQSATWGEGGEIFVLNMGKPVRILDLARQMIFLSGLQPERDIEITFTGLRPGEKLFEELSHCGENIAPTHHPKIMRFVSDPPPYHILRSAMDVLNERLHTEEPNELKLLLKSIIPEYMPYLS